jgi:hypothetical protein
MDNFRALQIVYELADENIITIYQANENDMMDARREQITAIERILGWLVEAEKEGSSEVQFIKPKRWYDK